MSSNPAGRLTRALTIHTTALMIEVLALELYLKCVIHCRSFINYLIRVFLIHAQTVVLLSIFQPWMNWNCCCRRKVCCENRSSQEKEQGMSFTLSPLFARSNVGIIPAPLSADKVFIEGARVDWIDFSNCGPWYSERLAAWKAIQYLLKRNLSQSLLRCQYFN